MHEFGLIGWAIVSMRALFGVGEWRVIKRVQDTLVVESIHDPLLTRRLQITDERLKMTLYDCRAPYIVSVGEGVRVRLEGGKKPTSKKVETTRKNNFTE